MLNQIVSSDDWVELSDGQQELLMGGESQQNSNNFAQNLATTNTSNTAGPSGNLSSTNTQISDINSNANSLLSTNAMGMPTMSALNNMPIPNNPISNSFF